jgi:hypothetical protein
VNAGVHRPLSRRKPRILRRSEDKPGVERPQPMTTASDIHHETAATVRGVSPGGSGAVHLLARKVGSIHGIDAGRRPRDGRREQGADRSDDGIRGRHPPVASPADTGEPLSPANRSGDRPSHERPDVYPGRAAALGRRAGFRKITRRGDTQGQRALS